MVFMLCKLQSLFEWPDEELPDEQADANAAGKIPLNHRRDQILPQMSRNNVAGLM
jgi:hypothetical protein